VRTHGDTDGAEILQILKIEINPNRHPDFQLDAAVKERMDFRIDNFARQMELRIPTRSIPPALGNDSNTVTGYPRFVRCQAADNPAGPAPMTAIRGFLSSISAGRVLTFLIPNPRCIVPDGGLKLSHPVPCDCSQLRRDRSKLSRIRPGAD